MSITTSSRAGLSIGSSRFDEETRIFLQRRLRILTTSVSALFLVLSIGFIVSLTGEQNRNIWRALRHFCTGFPNSVLFFLAVSSSGLSLLLWRKRVGKKVLFLVDALFLQVLIGPCLLLYARLHYFTFSGFAAVVPFLMLFILARAILIPSGAGRTILLSLPAALGVFFIQLKVGGSYIAPDQAFDQSHYLDTFLQNQVLLLGSIMVAATASRVNLGLRLQNFNARHIGQYKIERLLGRGGMGEVYLATHSLLKRPTALKFLRPEITGDHSLIRFEKEVRHSSRLSHPHSINIFDYGHTADGIFYYAMELLNGANLRQVVSKTGPMPPARVIHILVNACGALGEAHAKGMVHRDVKPENIMLCEQGGELDFVKILDFGLVKEYLTDKSPQGEPEGISGTPEIIPPEVLQGKPIGPSSDIYSLCAVGCYLLTGRPIFDVETVQDFLHAHCNSAPVPPSRRRPGMPSDLESILLRGLEKDPAARHKNMTALRVSLLECRDARKWGQTEASSWWAKKGLKIIDSSEDRKEAGLSPGREMVTETIQDALNHEDSPITRTLSFSDET